MSNVVIVCTCFSSIFSNELITSVVFFQSLSFNFSRNQMLILSNTVLQILPISFFAGFNNLVVGWFTKLSLWSFKVKKQVLVPLISILSNISARFAYFVPYLFIIVSIPFVAFLYLTVTLSTKIFVP